MPAGLLTGFQRKPEGDGDAVRATCSAMAFRPDSASASNLQQLLSEGTFFQVSSPNRSAMW
jgi:hypothetical protein